MPRITITQPGKTPQPYHFDLTTNDVRLGRNSGNDIILECGSISGYHAEMARVPGGFELRDLGSTNGITVNGNPIREWRLSGGDHVLLGDVLFDFQVSEEESGLLAAEIEPNPDSQPQEPAKKTKRKRKPVPDMGIPSQRRGPSAGVLILVFLVFGSITFYVGLSMRHENETGVSLAKRLTTQPEKLRDDAAPENEEDDFLRQTSEAEEDYVVAPVEIEEVPPEIEGWDDRERADDQVEEQGFLDTGGVLEEGDDAGDDEDRDDGGEDRDDRGEEEEAEE